MAFVLCVSPDAFEAKWHVLFVCLFTLYVLFYCLSLPDASAASGRFVLSSPNASVAILALFVCLFVVCFLLQAPEAIWH